MPHKDPDKRREQQRKYYLANKTKLAAQHKVYYMENKTELNEKSRKYYAEHIEDMREYGRRYAHDVIMCGKTAKDNPTCASYLGVYVAERVLSKVFADVVTMPPCNPGYDFICNGGKKIDVKSACIQYDRNRWSFGIKRNCIADYFLCVAFDNRVNLEPQHIWLIPGEKIKCFSILAIPMGATHRWAQYELDIIEDVRLRCDEMRGDNDV